MTKYTNNEQYEKDKAALIEYCESPMAKLGYHSQQKIDEISNLLKQSKWIGDSDKPIPVVKDKAGKLTKHYSTRDWFNKLNEELDEVKSVAKCLQCHSELKYSVAEELQDLITVCTSFLNYLGYDETARGDLAKQINEKNRQRGYFEEVFK